MPVLVNQPHGHFPDLVLKPGIMIQGSLPGDRDELRRLDLYSDNRSFQILPPEAHGNAVNLHGYNSPPTAPSRPHVARFRRAQNPVVSSCLNNKKSARLAQGQAGRWEEDSSHEEVSVHKGIRSGEGIWQQFFSCGGILYSSYMYCTSSR